ncbi:MAG: class I SAM-dependent methyltransferase [Planctomycetota bacterium]
MATTAKDTAEKGSAKQANKPKRDRATKVRSSTAGGAESKKKDGKKRDRRLNAKNADRYELYQRAVNSPETDVEFLEKAYRHYNDREPKHLREDFCGTAAMCAEWLTRGPERTAEGVDLDSEPIEWGKRHNFPRVDGWEERMTFHLQDVRSGVDQRPDVTAAQNFSYWCFKTRQELLDYFRAVREDLAEDGVFVLDLYGGPEATVEQEEVRSLGGGIEYVWDQREYIPATGTYSTAIHFRFKDGSEMTDAFEYEWRFWSITEIRDVLYDVGFRAVTTWFEGTDPDDPDEGDGNFEIDERGENCEAWIGYLVAQR